MEISSEFNGMSGITLDFLNGLPGIESLIIYTDADGPPWLERYKKKLREVTSAKLVILEIGDCCGLHPWRPS